MSEAELKAEIDRLRSCLRAVASVRPDSEFDEEENRWRKDAAKALEANGWSPPCLGREERRTRAFAMLEREAESEIEKEVLRMARTFFP